MLKMGVTGPAVKDLQDKLQHLGLFTPTFDASTKAAVVSFQERFGLKPDGIVGPQTEALLERALRGDLSRANVAHINGEAVPVLSPEVGLLRDTPAHIWERFHRVINMITGGLWDDILAGRKEKAEGVVVRYGPGRGHFLSREAVQQAVAREYLAPDALTLMGNAPGLWVVSCGPTRLGQDSNVAGGWQGPTFHCSSFTNWLMGMLLDYNAEYTHTGNMPGLKSCLMTRHALHPHSAGKGSTVYYRGFAEHCARLAPDGTSPPIYKREYLDPEEVWRRRDELGTINVFGQSTRTSKGWKIEHHTGVFFMHPDFPDVVFRIAADGSKGGNGYSGTPMDIERLTHAEALRLENDRRYLIYRLHNWPAPHTACPFTMELGRK